jgi:hypothetical protein
LPSRAERYWPFLWLWIVGIFDPMGLDKFGLQRWSTQFIETPSQDVRASSQHYNL